MVSLPDRKHRALAEKVTRGLRAAGLNVMTPLQEGGFGPQLKIANKHEARLAVLFGEDELARGELVVKELRSGEQQVFKIEEAVSRIVELLP